MRTRFFFFWHISEFENRYTRLKSFWSNCCLSWSENINDVTHLVVVKCYTLVRVYCRLESFWWGIHLIWKELLATCILDGNINDNFFFAFFWCHFMVASIFFLFIDLVTLPCTTKTNTNTKVIKFADEYFFPMFSITSFDQTSSYKFNP